MAKLYFDLIRAKKRNIEQVPIQWRAAVQALLDEAEEADLEQVH